MHKKETSLTKKTTTSESYKVDVKEIQQGKTMHYEEISLNFAIFSILLGITFAYLVFFSHQAAENESIISSKIVEINAINLPNPMQFLTFSGHKEYYYLRRKEVLLNEFAQLNGIIQKTNDTKLLVVAGREIQRCITQIT